MTKAERIARMEALLATANAEKRALTANEQAEFDGHEAACNQPEGKLRRIEGPAVHTKERKYSFARAMRAASGDRNVDAGYELEMHEELARGRKTAPEGFLIPLAVFKSQDGVTASPNTGEALTGEVRREDLFINVDEFFRPPIASALGVEMISCPDDKIIIPRQKKRLTGGWIARDGTAPTSQDAEFDGVTLEPKTYGLSFEMKRSLMYATHPDAERILLNDTALAVALALDDAILAGTGASNQPLGFLGTGGATVAASISGAMSASNAYDHSRKIRDECEAYLKNPSAKTAWLLHSMHTALLKKTPAFSGSQVPIIANGSAVFADKPYFESYGLPVPAGGPPKTTKGLYGDFSEATACVFGDAMEIVVNRWADSVYLKGGALVRVLVDFNVAHRDSKRVLRFDTETL